MGNWLQNDFVNVLADSRHLPNTNRLPGLQPTSTLVGLPCKIKAVLNAREYFCAAVRVRRGTPRGHRRAQSVANRRRARRENHAGRIRLFNTPFANPPLIEMKTLQAVRGMNDLLPLDSPRWQFFEDTVREVFEQYGYRLMRTPIIESTALFERSIGEVTDIVEKEMYSFDDRMNGDKLTLRPEATAGLVRAAIEHSLLYDGPKRVWTWGPMFRHERPQKGRYRQFHQFDVEALGFAGPDVDAEQIVLLKRVWDKLGFTNVRLLINSIGDAPARAAHRTALVGYFEQHAEVLDADAKRRLYTNPLRTLDSKNPAMQTLLSTAPCLADFLGADEKQHFAGVCALLDAAGVTYTVDPRLVRGIDYYCRTVFEWVAEVDGATLTIAAGGRYDGLIAELGGKAAPACGFGLGVERVMLLLAQQHPTASAAVLDGYVVYPGTEQGYAWRVAEQMRDAGLRVALHASTDATVASMKSQMKKADGSGARFAIIAGSDERLLEQIGLKYLQDGSQAAMSVDAAIAKMREARVPAIKPLAV
jgi:histidyl-tRNA synthetase